MVRNKLLIRLKESNIKIVKGNFINFKDAKRILGEGRAERFKEKTQVQEKSKTEFIEKWKKPILKGIDKAISERVNSLLDNLEDSIRPFKRYESFEFGLDVKDTLYPNLEKEYPAVLADAKKYGVELNDLFKANYDKGVGDAINSYIAYKVVESLVKEGFTLDVGQNILDKVTQKKWYEVSDKLLEQILIEWN